MGNFYCIKVVEENQRVMEQEKNICNFCGSTELTLCLHLKDHRLNLPGVCDLFQCQYCGLLYLSPQPDWDEVKASLP